MPVSRVNKAATKKLKDELKAAEEQLVAGAGHALAAWTLVEVRLTFVFCSLLDQTKEPPKTGTIAWEDEDPGRRMSHTILNAIIGFEARVDVVTAAAAESNISDELKSLWPGIAKRLKKGSKSRHEAAHFLITNIEQRDGSWKAFLSPFATSVGSVTDKHLTRTDLDAKTAKFTSLTDGMLWFRSEVERERGRRATHPEPVPELIQAVLKALESQNQAARS